VPKKAVKINKKIQKKCKKSNRTDNRADCSSLYLQAYIDKGHESVLLADTIDC
jgi:hypothetical protein